MKKIVIDTNVIVSSLIQWSYPFKIVFKVLNTIKTPTTSEETDIMKHKK